MDWPTLGSQILVGLTIAIVASVVTVRLALHRFRSERWWERAADTYTGIIEALHHRRMHLEAVIQEIQEGTDISEDRKRELHHRSAAAQRDLQRLRDVGVTFLSREAEQLLNEMATNIAQAHNIENWHEGLDREASIVKRMIVQMRDAARRDLKA